MYDNGYTYLNFLPYSSTHLIYYINFNQVYNFNQVAGTQLRKLNQGLNYIYSKIRWLKNNKFNTLFYMKK
jgi:hypothetical protein